MLKLFYVRKLYKPSGCVSAYTEQAENKKELMEKIKCELIAWGMDPLDYDIKIRRLKSW